MIGNWIDVRDIRALAIDLVRRDTGGDGFPILTDDALMDSGYWDEAYEMLNASTPLPEIIIGC